MGRASLKGRENNNNISIFIPLQNIYLMTLTFFVPCSILLGSVLFLTTNPDTCYGYTNSTPRK